MMSSNCNYLYEGSPLLYLPVYRTIPSPPFQYFNRFDMENARPESPHSVQSDSDNSISSLDGSPKTVRKLDGATKSEVQCCWRSCGLFFESLDQLATHVSKVHSASGPGGLFYCGWDGCTRNNKGFNARYKMLVHVRTHTNEKPHQCFLCEKSFSRAENLKIHSRSHSGEKPYVCPVPGCNKAYSNSSDRFKHTRTHQVEKPYQCKVPGCPKKYTDPSSLRKHVKTYKHFVNENNIPTRLESNKTTIEDNCYKQSKINENNSCTCSHTCCVTNSINQAAELLKLKAFIDFRENDYKWKQVIIDPLIRENKKLYTPYDMKEDRMDVDAPLDLSVSRKH